MQPMYAIGMPSGMEWVFILAIVMILFGAGKVPQVMKAMGEGMKGFKDAQKDPPEPPTDVTPPPPPKEIVHKDGVSEAHEVKSKV